MGKILSMPENAEIAVELLRSSGYEAYAVGGCVRDSLLGKSPDDWDITTSARPDEIKRVFGSFHCIDTGIEHGTVTVVINSQPFEITSFRLDGEYEDNRHPKNVTFTSDLSADLSRRDFTVNAMAYAPGAGIVDLFGGREDLADGVIRCVGDPDRRRNARSIAAFKAAFPAFDVENNLDLKSGVHVFDGTFVEASTGTFDFYTPKGVLLTVR